MRKEEIYRVHSPYRQDMVIRGYFFGKGEPAACIVGSTRGNEMQQMYICSQLVRILKELEGNTSGEGEKVSEAAEVVANSTILSMLGLKADASGTGFHLSGRRR